MNDFMQAQRFYSLQEGLKFENISVPRPGPGEALIDIKATGICGSDLHIVFEGVTQPGFSPIILGHEPSGIIASLGEEESDFNIGDPVVVSSLLFCGECFNCLKGDESICTRKRLLGIHENGGLAQYMVAPVTNLFHLPDNLSFSEGAIVSDAVATPFHAIRKKGRLQAGETALVIGCGGLGIHAVQICKLMGASRIIALDIEEERLDMASKVGATHVVNSKTSDPHEHILEITHGEGPPVAFELVGKQETILLAAQCLRPGGRLVVCGLGPENIRLPPPTSYVRNELEVIGSYAWDRTDISLLMDLLSNGVLDISSSITAKYSLQDTYEALHNLHTKKGNPIRNVVVQN